MKIGAIYSYSANPKQKKYSVNFNSARPTREQLEERADLSVLSHHIYEYKKGLRNLILTTEKSKYREKIEERLKRQNIDYYVQDVNPDIINVFFGAEKCIEVVKTFNNKKLNKLTPEQDFILGIMLGYDRLQQCDRYLKTKNHTIKLSYPEE
jgi:hypothetical protein